MPEQPAALVNAVQAADRELRGWLVSSAYVAMIGAITLAAVAGVAARVPAAWREWRHPSRLPRTSGTLVADLEVRERPGAYSAASEPRVIAADGRGVIDPGRLGPGDRSRLGDAIVEVNGFSYGTILSRDHGAPVLFAAAGLLSASLAAACWLPRRRASLAPSSHGVTVLLRGERFDDAQPALKRLVARLRPMAVVGDGPRPT